MALPPDRRPLWVALSDSSDPLPPGPDRLTQGSLVLEFTPPLQSPAVLLDAHAGPGRAFSVFYDPIIGIAVLQREGATVKRHLLPGPLSTRPGLARLTFAVDGPRWTLMHEQPDAGVPHTSTGTTALALSLPDLHALCTNGPGTTRHPAVQWLGVTRGTGLPGAAPWIGLNTPIDTRRGPVRAGHLRPGDQIATLDDGFRPLMALHRHTLPAQGSHAPVLLRSPFFGLTTDILVSPEQMVLISGASVEYLYGVEQALIPAAALCDGHVAARDGRRAVTQCLTLDLGPPLPIRADGCCLMSAFAPCDALPRRALRTYETQPLRALLGHTALRHVA